MTKYLILKDPSFVQDISVAFPVFKLPKTCFSFDAAIKEILLPELKNYNAKNFTSYIEREDLKSCFLMSNQDKIILHTSEENLIDSLNMHHKLSTQEATSSINSFISAYLYFRDSMDEFTTLTKISFKHGIMESILKLEDSFCYICTPLYHCDSLDLKGCFLNKGSTLFNDSKPLHSIKDFTRFPFLKEFNDLQIEHKNFYPKVEEVNEYIIQTFAVLDISKPEEVCANIHYKHGLLRNFTGHLEDKEVEVNIFVKDLKFEIINRSRKDMSDEEPSSYGKVLKKGSLLDYNGVIDSSKEKEIRESLLIY